MHFTLDFETNNAAFDPEGEPEHEIERILRTVAIKILNGYTSGVIKDINGNKIGNYTWVQSGE